MVSQRVQDTVVDGHQKRLASFDQLDLEWFVVCVRFRIRTEALEMHSTAGPMSRHVLDLIHQALGATAVDVHSRLRFLENGPQIERLLGIAVGVMDNHTARKLR